MIKKLLLSTVTLGAFCVSAYAADLPSRRAPPVYIPPPIPVFTWTGFYVGAQAGYAFGSANSLAVATSNGAGLASNAGKANGVIGGAHVGYNYSTQSLLGFGGFGGGGLLVGIEGDVDGSNYKSTYALGGITDSTKRQIQGSVRGRVGFTVDRALFYATGGAAFGDIKNNYTNALNGLSDSLSHTRVGYTVGGGIEYAVTNNVSLRAEYRYTDYGNVTDSLLNSTAGGGVVRHREKDNRVQAGISYKFDTFAPVPVVARY